ncbi:fimbrial assembly protein [Pseudomonas moraviensis subsp. stanleyae]|uniref:CS1 type fimbrial major subunit n=1 Tax=Pseudomonas moraviensis TaxID=321662 RepID=UPI002E368F61|nr:CS1 type fimbrial major subunit [Pseudomonas moraviensis]MED7667244.1 fimbrial assembly protein [Pseudomonas moraviensis subsp. stanleyae]
MIKQCIVSALMVATALTATLAWAAREEHTFEVSLTIPSRPFYIIPADPDWIHRPQVLAWNPVTESLGNLEKYFDVRHDSSAIDARLAFEPFLDTGESGEVIDLRVTFNGVELSSHITPRQVVSQEEAAAGKRALLKIEPIKPSSGFRSGQYSGNVVLLFSASAPEAG